MDQLEIICPDCKRSNEVTLDKNPKRILSSCGCYLTVFKDTGTGKVEVTVLPDNPSPID